MYHGNNKRILPFLFSDPKNSTCVTVSQQIASLFSDALTTVPTIYLRLLYADFILRKLYLSEPYCTLLCLDVASSRYILWQCNSGVTWFFPLTLRPITTSTPTKNNRNAAKSSLLAIEFWHKFYLYERSILHQWTYLKCKHTANRNTSSCTNTPIIIVKLIL